MPPQEKTPMPRLVVYKPTDEAVRLELEARLEALEAAVKSSQEAPEQQSEAEEPDKQKLGKVARRKRRLPRDYEDIPTTSSAETEAEGDKMPTDAISIDTDHGGTSAILAVEKEPPVKPAE